MCSYTWMPEEGTGSPGIGVTGRELSMCMLGMELWISTEAASTLNHGAIIFAAPNRAFAYGLLNSPVGHRKDTEWITLGSTKAGHTTV